MSWPKSHSGYVLYCQGHVLVYVTTAGCFIYYIGTVALICTVYMDVNIHLYSSTFSAEV